MLCTRRKKQAKKQEQPDTSMSVAAILCIYACCRGRLASWERSYPPPYDCRATLEKPSQRVQRTVTTAPFCRLNWSSKKAKHLLLWADLRVDSPNTSQATQRTLYYSIDNIGMRTLYYCHDCYYELL